MTSAVGRSRVVLESLLQQQHFYGDWLVDADADADAIVYAVSSTEMADVGSGWRVTEGHVNRVVGDRAVPIPEAPPARHVAVAGDRVAIALAGRGLRRTGPPVETTVNGEVEIRDVVQGTLIARFVPRGIVRELALSDRVAAVLVQRAKVLEVQAFDPESGVLLKTWPVPPRAAQELDASGDVIVYRVGRTLYKLDVAAARASVVAVAANRPWAITIEDGRIYWAERVGDGTFFNRGHVRMIDTR